MARIVIIDDDSRLLQAHGQALEVLGHRVVYGRSFAAVSLHLRPGKFDLLVTDALQFVATGKPVLAEVVAKRKCQEPVILITGDTSFEAVAVALGLGAFDVLKKPVLEADMSLAVVRGLDYIQILRKRDQARLAELELLRNLVLLSNSAAQLSHEIRTPITSLRQALRAVADRIGLADRVLVEDLIGNLGRIDRLLNQALSFARAIPLQPRPVSLPKLIGDAAAIVQSLAVVQSMTVVTRCLLSNVNVVLDQALFTDVLVNLLRNAAEACNGIGRIEISAEIVGSKLRLEVADDGPGIPASLRNDIFKPFFATKEGGAGIGLALCRKIVESHAGSLSLADRSGPGACFRIELDQALIQDY